jgi:hypothetical protein
MATRKGPTESATQYSVGTKRKGNDGQMWVVRETKTGTRRWQLVRSVPSTSLSSPRLTLRGGAHRIVFCEPYSWSGRGGVEFQVSDRFYPVLLRAPKSFSYRKKFDVGNAYLFGPRFPVNSYVFVGEHGNDGAQTGFIDLGLYDRTIQKNITDIVLSAYSSTGGRKLLKWDNRRALGRLRTIAPYILFLGETCRG